MSTQTILKELVAERLNQDAKFGEQNHPDGTGARPDQWAAHNARVECDVATEKGELTWKHILKEEVFEAFAERDPERLREELVQVAAVAVAWIEHIDRRDGVQVSPGGAA